MNLTLVAGITERTAEMEREIVSKIPALLLARGWSEREFVGECIKRDLSLETAQRLARGDTKTTTRTLIIVADVFGVTSICELMDLQNSKHKPGN